MKELLVSEKAPKIAVETEARQRNSTPSTAGSARSKPATAVKWSDLDERREPWPFRPLEWAACESECDGECSPRGPAFARGKCTLVGEG